MSRQGALVACAVVTVLASVRLLTSVYSQVRRQGALVACVVVTVLTSVRLLTSVYSQVSRQGALIACAEATVLASARLLTSVHSQVSHQGALLACTVVTVLTSVRLLTSVHPQVSRQVALESGLVSAVLANMLEHRGVQSIEGPARWTRSCQVCLALVGVSRCWWWWHALQERCTAHALCSSKGSLVWVSSRTFLWMIAVAEIVVLIRVLIAPPVVGETLSAQLGGTVLRRHRWLGGGLLKWRPATGGRLSGHIHFTPSVHVDVACL